MIFLFNNREELCGLIEFSELSSLTHILEINAFDLSTFEVPVEYVFGKLGKAQFFGFFLDPDNPQPDSFKIFKIREKSIGDTLVVSGIDKAESDLKHIKIIEDKRPNGNPAKILSVILEGTGYQVGVVSNLEQLSKQLYFYYLSPKEALAKLIEAFKCEFSITYTLNNNRITARHVNLYQKMGRDSGQQYEHGSDLLSVVYEEEADNVVTALIGRGKGEAIEDDEGLKTGGYSRRIDFKDVVWSKANGNPLDKPLGQNYLALENSAYALYQDGVAKHRFGVFIAEDIEDKNELINATYKELLSLSVPVTTYKAELVELYSGAWLGDSIAIFRDDAGIAFAARLYKIKVDKLDHNRSTVELGEYEAFKKLEVSSNSRLSMAMSDIKALAEGALKSADGKNTLFGDLSEPTNAREGDIWFKRNGNEDEMWQYRLIDGRLQWVYVAGDRYAKQIKEQVDSQFAEVTQQITEQQQAHDRTVAEILAQAESTEAIAQEAKRIGDQAKADAVNLASQLSTAKTALQNSINDTKSQIATVSQALTTAKSELQTQVTAIDTKAMLVQVWANQLRTDIEQQGQTILSQAQAQNTLTN
ncbi:MAG: phage tail spike protein, partial [Streptococcus orisratti]|uniref:phage tail spike protein n=1 Tax=Streptococcus orisratti TaxID=114652 RepID=UPI002A917F53